MCVFQGTTNFCHKAGLPLSRNFLTKKKKYKQLSPSKRHFMASTASFEIDNSLRMKILRTTSLLQGSLSLSYINIMKTENKKSSSMEISPSEGGKLRFPPFFRAPRGIWVKVSAMQMGSRMSRFIFLNISLHLADRLPRLGLHRLSSFWNIFREKRRKKKERPRRTPISW